MPNVQVTVGLGNEDVANLRNGGVHAIQAPARRGAIPAAYHWVGVSGTGRNLANLHTWSAAAFGQLVACEPAVVDPAGIALAGPGDIAYYGDFGLTPARAAELRIFSLIVGSARNAFFANYNVLPGDLQADEVATFDYITVAGDVWTLTSGCTDAAADLSRGDAAALSYANFSADEMTLAVALAVAAAALPPLTGVSIIETKHHFLSKDAKAIRGVIKQMTAPLHADVKALWNANHVENLDKYAHKAPHALSDTFLISTARDSQIGLRIAKVGQGAAALRLPYVESEVKAAQAYVAIIDSIRTWGTRNDMIIVTPILKDALSYTMAAPHGVPAGVAFQNHRIYANRAEVIERILKPAKEFAASIVATAAGVYTAIMEDAPGSLGDDTKISAYSIKKLRESHGVDFAQGAQDYKNVKAWNRKNAEEGRLATYQLTDVPQAGQLAIPAAPAALMAVAAAPVPVGPAVAVL